MKIPSLSSIKKILKLFMKANYRRQFVLLSITFLMVLFAIFEPSYALCEEILSQNLETDEFPAQSDLNIMEEIDMLYHNLHIGTLGIKPSYEIIETYDDNVFNTSEDETADLYTLHQFDIGLLSPLSDYSLVHLDYNAKIYEYMRIQDLNHVNQSLDGGLDFNFANDFKFSFSDRIKKSVIPPGVQRRFFGDIIEDGIPIEDQGPNAFVNQRNLTTNTASFDLDFPDFFPNLDFSIHYVNRDVSYQEEEFKDSDYNVDILSAIVEYQYPFLPIEISSGFLYSIVRYDSSPNRDSRRKEVPFDIEWKITPKNELYLISNYKTSNYGSQSTLENFEGFETILGNRYLVTPVSSIEIFAERSVKEQRSTDNNSYFLTAIGLKYTWEHDRFDASIEVDYFNLKFFERNDALGVVEEVNGISVNLSIIYSPQDWWFAEFDYGYNRRNNIIDLGDLTKNTVSLSAGLSF